MPGTEIAQYGIGFFAVAGMIYIVTLIVKSPKIEKSNLNIIQNNTDALNSLKELISTLQLSQTRQEAKIDELLAKARKK
jgi:hypothetical protein